jgi:hypothetical protein
MSQAKRIAVKELRADSIDAAPVNIEDWREVFGEFEENHFWEASQCDGCDYVHVFQDGGNASAICEGPMMNYWYPADLYLVGTGDAGAEEAARRLADLPLCVVQVNGDYGLALSGGGMDLSWEICEAYTRLGLLPPAHFCRLPRMAGRGISTRDKYILSACRATLAVAVKRARYALRDLRSFGKKAA